MIGDDDLAGARAGKGCIMGESRSVVVDAPGSDFREQVETLLPDI